MEYSSILKAHQTIFNQYVLEYEERTKNAHQKYLASFFLEFCASLPKDSHVLDMGCAVGRDVQLFSKQGFSVLGIDAAKNMVSHCQNKGLPVEQQDFLTGEWQTKQWDGIWAYTSLTLVPKDIFHELLEKIQRALKSGGFLARISKGNSYANI